MCKRSVLWLLSGVFALILLGSFIMQPAKKNIWMIGDSTMAPKGADKFPETGWGMAFSTKFNPEVTVHNKARNGRSTKSCINEGIWSEVYNGLKQDDYVFIQFGHNDEKIHKPNTGTTIEEYKANLSFFVAEVRTKGATPILLTPIARRAFEEGVLVDTHGAYPGAVRQVADSLNVLLIDLTAQTTGLLLSLGEEDSKSLFLHLPEGHRNYPKGVTDNTHLSVEGAEAITSLVVKDIMRQGIPLMNDLKNKE